MTPQKIQKTRRKYLDTSFFVLQLLPKGENVFILGEEKKKKNSRMCGIESCKVFGI
jgi:hypothetical protein